MKKSIIGVLLGVVCLASTPAVLAGDFLSADELRAAVTDKTFKGVHLKKDYSYVTFNGGDGIVTQIKDDGSKETGKWRVDDDGKHCVEWDGSGQEKCFPVKDNGDGSLTKTKVTGNGKQIPLLQWTDFKDGNQLPTS